jgi:hypothetical protein
LPSPLPTLLFSSFLFFPAFSLTPPFFCAGGWTQGLVQVWYHWAHPQFTFLSFWGFFDEKFSFAE